MSLLPLGILSSSGAGGTGAFELISTQVLTSTATSITFSSIPGTYKHLQIRAAAKATSDGSAALNYRLNSDTGTNYSWHYLATNGSSITSYGTSATTLMRATLYYWGMSSTYPVAHICDILDYANTNKYKTIKALSGQAGSSANELGLHSGLWQSTSAVTSVTILCSTAAIGSRFSLYGVKGS